MLLNLSNHPSANWLENQKAKAIKQYLEIQDLPFPKIDPNWSKDEIVELVEEYEIKIRQLDPTAVHIMGEMTFVFNLVQRLKSIGIPCIASTTERKVEYNEQKNKISTFRFVQFREY